MWTIEAWIGPKGKKRWVFQETKDSFEEALEAVQILALSSKGCVARGTMKPAHVGELCGLMAYPFRGWFGWKYTGD